MARTGFTKFNPNTTSTPNSPNIWPNPSGHTHCGFTWCERLESRNPVLSCYYHAVLHKGSGWLMCRKCTSWMQDITDGCILDFSAVSISPTGDIHDDERPA